jgi:ERF superfamily
MQRSSESFAALATALAKAQAHLVNPEKSLTAIIAGGRPGEMTRSFRYAPLSSGLEIIRKTLSGHELAVIQTTAVDQSSRVLTLTTMLAHSSGEWIASYWPVCSVADIANPHRMGAALTYARRYTLFTLVGIAGEDDLDAPDLCMPRPVTGPSPIGAQLSPPPPGNGKMRTAAKRASMPAALSPDESAALRERLLGEIAALQSQESATTWAREALSAKNKLTAADAKALENAFEQRLAYFLSPEITSPVARTAATAAGSGNAPSVAPSTSQDIPRSEEVAPINGADPHQAGMDQPTGRIDKSVLTISAPRRYRSKEHLRYVMAQPCLFCARKPSDAHHLRFMQPRALGRKTSDEFVVPLCRTHHRAAHRAANEQAWWNAIGIDPVKVAHKLWKESRVGKPNDAIGEAARESHQPTSSTVDNKAP